MPAAGAEYGSDFAGSPEAARQAVQRAAAKWGARVEPAATDQLLVLPVVAGLRRGVARGRVSVLPSSGGCRLAFRVDEVDLYVHKPAVVVLAISAGGGLVAFLWPFFPQILPVVPLALVLAVAGWLLVVARLHTSGPEEFLADVVAGAGGVEAR